MLRGVGRGSQPSINTNVTRATAGNARGSIDVAARRRGVNLGRAPKLTANQVVPGRAMIDAKEMTRGEIAAMLGVSPKTLWRALNGAE